MSIYEKLNKLGTSVSRQVSLTLTGDDGLELKLWIAQRCETTGKTFNAVFNEALREYREKHEKP